MRKSITSYSILIIGILCLVVACGPESEDNSEDICIPPLTEFAYDAGQGTPYPQNRIPPPDPWVLEDSVEMIAPYLLGVRNLPNNVDEIWILDFGLRGWERNPLNQVYIYRTDEAILRPIGLGRVFSSKIHPPKDIVITPDNSVYTTHHVGSRSKHPILGKYNEKTNEIEPISKLNKIPHDSFWHTIILFDQQAGIFWFLVPKDYIYSYDPTTDTLETHIPIPKIIPGGAAIAADGKIYIHQLPYDGSGYPYQDALFLYSPNDETIEKVFFDLEVIKLRTQLLVDHSERLWVGSYGWREPDGQWYQLVRSPLFIQAIAGGDSERFTHWSLPDIKFETSDGLLWFTGAGGSYSLNLTKREWCWFSTSSMLDQDANGNLWMIAGGKLYSYRLNP